MSDGDINIFDEEISRVKKLIKNSDFQKEKAELLFVLAVLYAKSEQKDLAVNTARECIGLLNTLPTNTLEDCAATRIRIGSVFLPELFHQGTVRERMKCFGINLLKEAR